MLAGLARSARAVVIDAVERAHSEDANEIREEHLLAAAVMTAPVCAPSRWTRWPISASTWTRSSTASRPSWARELWKAAVTRVDGTGPGRRCPDQPSSSCRQLLRLDRFPCAQLVGWHTV